MTEKRVKFYPGNDLLYGRNFSKIETMDIPDILNIDINDAIEFFEIKQYFDYGTRLTDWSDKQFREFREKSQSLYGLTNRFFNSISDSNLLEIYKHLDFDYTNSFWQLFEKTKLFERISENVFDELLNSESIAPHEIFSKKCIVKKYQSALKKYILDNSFSIRILISYYEQDALETSSKEKWFLPDNLTSDEVYSYLENYIKSDKANLNVLRTIIKMKDKPPYFCLDERIKCDAQNRYNKITNEWHDKEISISTGIEVKFSKEQLTEYACSNNDGNIIVSYSLKWLKETLDYPSILNNFIYLFGFVDYKEMRCALVSKKSTIRTLENIFISKLKTDYKISDVFRAENILSAMQLEAYHQFLENNDIALGEVAQWFFAEYIVTEFGCPEIKIGNFWNQESYCEKCKSICIAMDSILKQYDLFVRTGTISYEYLKRSEPKKIEAIKSLNKKKYISGCGKDFDFCMNALFSNQSILLNVKRLPNVINDFHSFVDMTNSVEIFESDYQNFNLPAINKLKNMGIISTNAEGCIKIKNNMLIFILKDLYQNDVISKWHYPSDYFALFDELENKGMLKSSDTLFSAPECNYFNYWLNNSEYDNGYALRNQYVHGIQEINPDDNEHKTNYYYLLRLLIIIIIKINDDLCINDSQKCKENENA